MSRVGQVLDEIFDSFTGGVFERFGAAEIGSVGLDQPGIELVLADDLAQPIADFVAIAVAIAVLRRELGGSADAMTVAE